MITTMLIDIFFWKLGVLTDVLSYVLAKDFRQHMKEDQDMTPMVPQRRISQQGMVQDVLRNCFTLLHSLAYKNEPVRSEYMTIIFICLYQLNNTSYNSLN